jgi:hypothetical protein
LGPNGTLTVRWGQCPTTRRENSALKGAGLCKWGLPSGGSISAPVYLRNRTGAFLAFLAHYDWGYAGSWIRASENLPTRHLGE